MKKKSAVQKGHFYLTIFEQKYCAVVIILKISGNKKINKHQNYVKKVINQHSNGKNNKKKIFNKKCY